MGKCISILDTTLRDGEQTPGVCFTSVQKLEIAQMLLVDLAVDRIEIGSARTSQSERAAFYDIGMWAHDNGYSDNIEILGFTDHTKSVDWLIDIPYTVLSVLCKGSLEHCEKQLGKTPKEHFFDICATLDYAIKHGKRCNVFLEDWSRGIVDSPDYVMQLMEVLEQYPVQRVYLCDTLGTLGPMQIKTYVGYMVKHFPEMVFELHCHNDYGLAVANYLAALECGVYGFHVTINGLGERAGNAALEELALAVRDLTSFTTNINEGALMDAARLIAEYSHRPIAKNKPIIGEDVFTHTSGVHADGQKKGNLYTSCLNPSRFGRNFDYDLGKLSGPSNLNHHLSLMGLSLNKKERTYLIQALKNDLGKFGEKPPEKINRLLSVYSGGR